MDCLKITAPLNKQLIRDINRGTASKHNTTAVDMTTATISTFGFTQDTNISLLASWFVVTAPECIVVSCKHESVRLINNWWSTATGDWDVIVLFFLSYTPFTCMFVHAQCTHMLRCRSLPLHKMNIVSTSVALLTTYLYSVSTEGMLQSKQQPEGRSFHIDDGYSPQDLSLFGHIEEVN